MIEDELIYRDKKYVYRNYDKKRLLIVLNTHNQGDRYFGFSSLTDNPQSDLLFITDPNNGYYLDSDHGQTYLELIRIITDNYDRNNVCIFGTSMAGYAALHFGSKLNIQVISSNPQLDLELTYKISWENLRNSLDKMPTRPHLKDLIGDDKPKNIFLIYGEHRLDIANVEIFDQIDFGENTIIKKRVRSIEHGFFISDLANIFFIQDTLINLKDSY